jgi:hypothetical protein
MLCICPPCAYTNAHNATIVVASMSKESEIMKAKYLNIVCLPILVAIILGTTACTTMTLQKYQEPKEGSFRRSTSVNDLLVALEPILNADDYVKYFGTNLNDNGILAVHLSFKNVSTESSFLIPADSIRLTNKDYNGLSIYPISDDNKNPLEVSYSSIGVLVGISPLLGSKVYSDATIVQENFKSSRYRTSTIEVGENVSGFAYFNIKNQKRSGVQKLCFKVIDPIADRSDISCESISLEWTK